MSEKDGDGVGVEEDDASIGICCGSCFDVLPSMREK